MTVEKKRLLIAVIASNLSLVAAMVYSLASIRLAIVHLDKEGLGLISLIAQIVGYLAILDLGMGIAFNRILIDYNEKSREEFARALKTARLVFTSLGAVGCLAAVLAALFGSGLFNVPDSLAIPFRNILIVQGFTLFLSFLAKPLTAPAIANGRQDIVGWLSAGALVINTIVMSICFTLGIGIYSVLLGILSSGLFYFIGSKLCARKFIPESTKDVTFDRNIFREVCSFARDTVFWQIGGSCMYVLPTLLISVFYGVILVADLSGGMKIVLLLISICTRLPDMAIAPLSIQAAGGNPAKAADNLMRVSEVTGACGILGGIFIIAANPSFIDWWMLGEISWPAGANVAAALWLAVVTLGRSFSGYAVVTKQLQIIRFAPLWQCGILILLFFGSHSFLGPFAIVFALPLAEVIMSAIILYRMHHHTSLDARVVLPIISRQFLWCLVVLPLAFLGAGALSRLPLSDFYLFCATATFSGILGLVSLPLLLRSKTRREIFQTISSKWRPRLA
ncbi:hypothetical protein N9972_01445 [bacterium]|nr:hypothetical protein [bacterium]MDA8968878.1 hypothetical protein [Akkermansiaceae bacterium]MDB4318389.1 hypothetical protein [bacterium]